MESYEKQKFITPGKWYAEFDEKGIVVKTFYDDSYKKLLGYESEDEYSNTYENWVNDFHPDDRERVEACFSKCCAKHPEGMDFDIEYRMMTKRGYHLFHDHGTFIRREDGSPERCYGVIFDIQDSAERSEAQEQFKEQMQMIGGLASGYHALYYYNIDEGFFKVYSIDMQRFPEAKFFLIDKSKPVETFRKFGLSDLVHPDDKPFFANLSVENVRARLAHSKKLSYRFRRRFGDKYFWTELEIIKFEDIDERANTIALGFAERDKQIRQEQERVVEQELANQQRHLKSFGNMINAALWGVDIRGEADVFGIEWSDEMRHMLGYESEEDFPNVAESWSNLLHPDDRERTLKHLSQSIRSTTEGYVYDIRYRLLRKTGEYCWYHAVGRMEINDDGTRRLYGIITDISDEKQLEEQQRKLQEAYLAAEVANKSKTSFLFNMSHDIRTPMNAIMGFTTMAKKNVGDKDKIKDYLEKIDVSGQQLLMLINKVLEMSRIESGKVEFDFKPVNIREKYDSLVTVLAEQANVNGLDFHSSLIDIVHYNILADEARMGQVTLNITGNAIKYTPKGGRIDFSVREIPSEKNGYATYIFTVADTGIGMSKEYLQRLYEPFSREKSSTVSKIQGTGLGLSIVKDLIDLLGGKIEVQSELGKGTRFDITVDFKILDDGQEPIKSVDSSKDFTVNSVEDTAVNNQNFDFSPFRALLVEDNELNREIAHFILEDLGFAVEEAEDGDIAVLKVQNNPSDYFDVILMDIQMPVMEGYQATRVIRETVPDLKAPIIALSANAFEEDKQKSHDAGMDGHIAKPIDIEELKSTLKKFLM